MNLQYHLSNPAFAAMYKNAPVLEPVLTTTTDSTASSSNSTSFGRTLLIAGGIAIAVWAICVISKKIIKSKKDIEHGN
jgi:hypothetical protein